MTRDARALGPLVLATVATQSSIVVLAPLVVQIGDDLAVRFAALVGRQRDGTGPAA